MARIYDATVPLSGFVPVFPGDPRFEMSFAHRMDEGKPYNVARMTLGVHSGTHIDAPYHFLKDGATVEQLPLAVLIGPARVVFVDAPRAIGRADVEGLRLDGHTRVLFKTRNGDAIRRTEFKEDFVY
ncbi:MAG TPA: cyclase family protein, partial [Vicinamibacteria bacterium]|nr:cyclase family protein [Vicinamibacteria bacterium]